MKLLINLVLLFFLQTVNAKRELMDFVGNTRLQPHSAFHRMSDTTESDFPQLGVLGDKVLPEVFTAGLNRLNPVDSVGGPNLNVFSNSKAPFPRNTNIPVDLDEEQMITKLMQQPFLSGEQIQQNLAHFPPKEALVPRPPAIIAPSPPRRRIVL